MATVSDGIRPGGTCNHPDTYRCRESCECLCVPCWNKRHVEEVRRCSECGAICDARVQACECGPDCPLPTGRAGTRRPGSGTGQLSGATEGEA